MNFAHPLDIGLAVFGHLSGATGSDVVPDHGAIDILTTEFAALGRDVEGLAKTVQADAATQPAQASMVSKMRSLPGRASYGKATEGYIRSMTLR